MTSLAEPAVETTEPPPQAVPPGSGSPPRRSGPLRSARPRLRATRALELGAVTLVVAGLALVGTAAVPAALRDLGVTRVRVVQRDYAKSAPVGRVGVDAVNDFEKGIGKSVEKLERQEEERDVVPPSEARRIVLVDHDIPLHQSPNSRSPQVGLARSGDPIVVQTEEAGWLLVAHVTEDGLETGWIPGPEVSLR
ncbi:MAG TPA: hypothetical protein VL400_11710 [Polyangiaceae bacterium]|nr:hypothetical protein [Polyangiaceae bacterium]